MTHPTPDVEIFTGPNCGYCERAKALLADRGIPWRERDVGAADVRAEMKARLPREKTIPQIFIDGEHIGGLEDLQIRLGAPR